MNTNRRGFLSTLLKAGVGFSILPAATTYARTWKKQRHLWVVGWEDLEVAGTGGVLQFTESNCLGFYEILARCSKVIEQPDGSAQAFFDTIFQNKPIKHVVF